MELPDIHFHRRYSKMLLFTCRDAWPAFAPTFNALTKAQS